MRETTPLLPWRPAILSPGLELALHRHEHLDRLERAGRHFGAGLELLHLVLEAARDLGRRAVELPLQRLDGRHGGVVIDHDLPPLAARQRRKRGVVHGPARLHVLRPREDIPAVDQAAQARIDVALDDGALVVAVLGQRLDLLLLDGQSALVLFDAAAREHAHLDDGALAARRHAQRIVAHIGGLLAEDGPQQLLLGRDRALALRGDLADQDVAGLDFGAEMDNAGLVQLAQRLLADIGDVAGDLLLAQLGVAGHHLEFLDMDRGEHIVLHDAFGDQDRILEIVAVPRHERAQHIAPERELAAFRGGAVGKDLVARHRLAHLHQRRWVMQVLWLERRNLESV